MGILQDQIYKEGEPTWGCKHGVLDVMDVMIFIEKIKQLHKKHSGANFGVLWDIINKEAGEKLIQKEEVIE